MVKIVRPQFNQVQTSPLPSPLAPMDVPIGAFGAGVAAGTHSLGIDVAHVAIQERHAQNQIQVTQAAAAAEKWVTDNVYGPGGFMEMGGQDAMKRGSEIMKEYQAHIGKIRGGLNGQAQRMFDQGYSTNAMVDLDRAVQKQLAAVNNQYDDNSLAAAQTQLDNSAATAAAKGGVGVIHRPDGSVELEESSIQRMRDLKVAARVTWLQRNQHRLTGDKRLAAKEMLQSDLSKMHTQIIDAIAVEPGGEEVAKVYFEQHKDEIVPEVRNKFQESVTNAWELAQVETAAQSAFTEYKPSPLDGQDVAAGRSEVASVMSTVELEQAAVEELRTKLKGNPRLPDAEKRLRDLFQEQRYVDEADRGEKYNAMSKQLDQELNSPDPEVRAGAWQKIEKHPWYDRVLNDEQRTNLRAKNQRISAKEEVTTDEKLYYELLTSSQDPALAGAFNRLNLRDYEEKIDGPRLRKLQDIQADNIGAAAGQAGSGAYMGVRSPKEIVDTMITNNVLDQDEAAKFYARLEEVVVSDQTNMGRKLNSVEVQERADALWSSIILQPKHWWEFTSAENVYEIEPDDLTLADVPDDFQAEAKSHAANQGFAEPDEMALKQLYIKHLRRVGSKGHAEAQERQIKAKAGT